MDQAKQQVIEAIKGHSNVLVTVSTNPSVDELSAALGLTIMLNNLDKRATSVFSGTIPPAINFLEPDKTFENTADSLRDFIIALDKEKADHLRYKVEGEAVKIFITPYKTKLTEKDLEFSQGDYNVELIIAIGVTDQDHLDKALETHGKILHDATVITVTVGSEKSTLGSLDWHDDKASSLSEMIASLADGLKEDQPLLDQQVATALLTGIVSATDRFSNDRTTADVMTIAAQLMAAGANQQLVAAKLQEAHDITPSANKPAKKDESAESGTELTIERPTKKSEKSTSETSQENDIQAELEQHLAGVASSPSGTMADIERQLKEAAEQQASQPPVEQPTEQSPVPTPPAEETPPPPAPPTESPQPPIVESNVAPTPPSEPELTVASQDATMPGFEPTGAMQPPVLAPPVPPVSGQQGVDTVPPQGMVMPQPPPPEPVEPPKIIQRHDAITEPPGGSAGTPPINSIQDGSTDELKTIDPFTGAMDRIEAPPIMPASESVPNAGGGTPEGVAILNSTDSDVAPAPSNGTEEAAPPPPVPPTIPELPPLPPVPSDVSNIPLPPPPPPPPVDPSGSLPPMPSGPVAGDVFGDGSVQSSETPPSAPEPGQFRIPGQM